MSGPSATPHPPSKRTRARSRRSQGLPDVPSVAASPPSHWWTNPTIAVPSAIAIAGLLVSAYFALSPRSAPLTDPLAECQKQNPQAKGTAVTSTPMTPKGVGESSSFEGCVSTPIPGTDRAGHWIVGVRDYVIPGSFAAQNFTDVQVFDTSCVALALDYQFNSQETISHSRFTVETT